MLVDETEIRVSKQNSISLAKNGSERKKRPEEKNTQGRKKEKDSSAISTSGARFSILRKSVPWEVSWRKENPGCEESERDQERKHSVKRKTNTKLSKTRAGGGNPVTRLKEAVPRRPA